MAELSLSNVINIQVAQAGTGIGNYNTSNLAIFSSEPYAVTFGSDGYKIYLEPSEVEVDFGSDSITYAQALAVFSQRPNILANNGYLVVIPMAVEVQTITPSAAPASGTYILNFGGDATTAIQWDASAATIQTAVRTLTGLEQATVTGTLATHLTVTFDGYYGSAALMTVTSNTLNGGITLTVAEVTDGETLAEAISRTEDLIQYFGLMTASVLSQTDLLAAAAVIEATVNKIGIFVARLQADVEVGGKLDLLRSGNFHKSRGLLYISGTDEDALVFQAGYAGRGFSTNFSGSNTTQNMHLKDLSGVAVDTGMTQTIINLCKTAGADVYCSLQGVSKTFCSGANRFFDQVYNQEWFVGALQVAGFNYLAQAATKIPQTENGMDGLKGAYRKVCEQAVTNQYSAAGTWNSATTFGVQSVFLENIEQRGYYIYSTPIGQQSQADREDRIAPLVQIALKEAGAIDSSTVVVNINA